MLSLSSSDWLLKINQRITDSSQSGQSGEIPLTRLSPSLNSRFLIVSIKPKGVRNTWDFGGSIFVSYRFLSNQQFTSKHELRPDLFAFIEINQLFDSAYNLYYKPPKWFKETSVRVWEYVGKIPKSESNSDVIIERLNFIIDQVSDLSTKLEKEINQSDAGMYSLSQGISQLLSNQQGRQLRQRTKQRLNLNGNFL